jgi:hypothetical protein
VSRSVRLRVKMTSCVYRQVVGNPQTKKVSGAIWRIKLQVIAKYYPYREQTPLSTWPRLVLGQPYITWSRPHRSPTLLLAASIVPKPIFTPQGPPLSPHL